MDGITGATVFGLKDLHDFAFAVMDIVRCAAKWSVLDKVTGLVEHLGG